VRLEKVSVEAPISSRATQAGMAFRRSLCDVYLTKHVQEIIPDCVVLHTHEMSASQQHTGIRSVQSRKE